MDAMDKIAKEIERYDAVMCSEEGTPQEQERRCVEAAHECIAAIRLLVEDEPVNLNNPIAQLQERAQAKGLPLPEYGFERAGEDHVPTFFCVCKAEGKSATGRGKNKQKAKRMAAKAVLEALVGKG